MLSEPELERFRVGIVPYMVQSHISNSELLQPENVKIDILNHRMGDLVVRLQYDLAQNKEYETFTYTIPKLETKQFSIPKGKIDHLKIAIPCIQFILGKPKYKQVNYLERVGSETKEICARFTESYPSFKRPPGCGTHYRFIEFVSPDRSY